MNDKDRIQHFVNVMETVQNLMETVDKAGGVYNLETIKSESLIEFLDTCARNNIRFYYKVKEKPSDKISLVNIIKALEKQRGWYLANGADMSTYQEIIDKIRIIKSSIPKPFGDVENDKVKSKIKLNENWEMLDEIPFLEMVINNIEIARSERSPKSEVRHYFNEVLDRLRVLVSKISELEGGR